MGLGWATAGVALGVAVSGSLLAVASARLTPDMPFVGMAYGEFLMVMLAVFGDAGWQGLFGPIFTLGVILVGARAYLTARLDRWITGGFVALVAAYVLATTAAVTPAGRGLLRAAFGF